MATMVFYQNLLLLGFDPTGMERRHGINFKQNMFDERNPRAIEVFMAVVG